VSETWLNKVNWSGDGLVAAIAQDAVTGRVLMVAWMDREALKLTRQKGEAVYWSRSRKKLWHKGEESGHIQKVKEIRLDCDGDAILLQIEQQGGIACHTGRASCFYNRLENGQWVEVDAVLKSPAEIYPNKNNKA
jgi:phosphoribosyl-AMP cyclohydrolase